MKKTAEEIKLPDFLYKNSFGEIFIGYHGDTIVTDEWNKWVEEYRNQDNWISVEEKVNKLLEAITALHPNLNMGDKKQEALYLAFHELKSAFPSHPETK